ncbi:MAG: YkgJ family cysteine cluster protein [Lentisphaerae bacterium]|nr:YkgJ family cysteine cluster protein [Lentisphaerota bacterium]MCP4102219.1 YkgJ family cysteine cluster protein [Lentisphaerota bacterium]
MSNKGFKCARCGTCCCWSGYVRLQNKEVDGIAAFLDLTMEEFTAKYTVLTHDRRNLTLIEHEGGRCIFYEDNSCSCAINPVKPQQCRDFPLRWNFSDWEKECKGAQSVDIA